MSKTSEQYDTEINTALFFFFQLHKVGNPEQTNGFAKISKGKKERWNCGIVQLAKIF